MGDSTLRDSRPPAIVCRERGWAPGTRLIGDDGYGPTVIEITAVGEMSILAKEISHAGKRTKELREGLWGLDSRDWRATLPEPPRD